MPQNQENSQDNLPVSVLLPSMFAKRVYYHTTTTTHGKTVREVIAALEEQYPGIRFNLCLETGDLRPFVNIFVDGENIRYLRGLDTTVTPGATLHILPSVAGG